MAGRYSKSILSFAENSLKEGNLENRDGIQKKRKCKVLSLLDTVGADIIDAESLDFYESHLFFNMNRKEDYEKILEILKEK